MKRVELKASSEAERLHVVNMDKAIKSDKWMAVVWKVEDGKVVLEGRTTWNFPREDFMTAVDLLKKDCKDEMNETPLFAFGTKLPSAEIINPFHPQPLRDDGEVFKMEGN